MKYTAKQIREERICFENLTEEQFDKLKAHFQKLYPNDDYNRGYDDSYNISFRFYPSLRVPENACGCDCESHCNKNIYSDIKATKSITFDQFDFEEPSKNEYPQVMWVWDDCRSNPIKKKRVVFMEKCGKYISWNNAETLEDAEKAMYVSCWSNAENIIEPEQLTKQQIADLIGKDINSFEII